MTHYRAIQITLSALFMFTISGCATIGNISSTIAQPSSKKIIAAVDRCFEGSKAEQETVVRLYSAGRGVWKEFSENGFDYDYYDHDGEWYCSSIKFTAGLNRIAEAQRLLANKLTQNGKRVLLYNIESGPSVVGYLWLPDYNLSMKFVFDESYRMGMYESQISFESIKSAAKTYIYDDRSSRYDKKIDVYSNISQYPVKSKEWYQEIPNSFKNLAKRLDRRNEAAARRWRKEAAFYRLSVADFSGGLANASSKNIFTLQSPYGNNANFVPTYIEDKSPTSSVKSGESGKVSPKTTTESGKSSGSSSSYTSSGGSGVKAPSTANGSSKTSGSGSNNSGTSSVKAPGTASSSSNSSGSGSNSTSGSSISFTAIKNPTPEAHNSKEFDHQKYLDRTNEINRMGAEEWQKSLKSAPNLCPDKSKGCAINQ